MSFCPNCGQEINETAAFCGNCGNQLSGESPVSLPINKPNAPVDVNKFYSNLNLKDIWHKIKAYFSACKINYESRFFTFAMMLFLAFGAGLGIYDIIQNFLPGAFFKWSDFAGIIYKYGLCLLLFGVQLLVYGLTRSKKPKTSKKHPCLIAAWLVTLLLNILLFIADIRLYKYVLYSGIVDGVVKVLLVIFTILLLYKNRPRYPFVWLATMIVYALNYEGLWYIRLSFSLYSLNSSFDNLIAIFTPAALGLVILALLSLIIRYILPDKISRWVIVLLAMAIIACGIVGVSSFTVHTILSSLIEVVLCLIVVFFVLSCSRNTLCECVSECGDDKPKTKFNVLKIGIISTVITAVLTLALLAVSAIVSATHINTVLATWKSGVMNATITTDYKWDEINKDINKYTCTALSKGFIDDYDAYITIDTCLEDMRNISLCYSAYKGNRFTSLHADKYSEIDVDSDWANNAILSKYYSRYLEMQPDKDKVSVWAHVDPQNGKITVEVTNGNVLPLSECTVRCNFTIGFIGSSYYSDTEYGRGSETITIENVGGKSSTTETIYFNPDRYYDSYGSYLMSFVFASSAELVSIN